jgi:hypothetical protein
MCVYIVWFLISISTFEYFVDSSFFFLQCLFFLSEEGIPAAACYGEIGTVYRTYSWNDIIYRCAIFSMDTMSAENQSNRIHFLFFSIFFIHSLIEFTHTQRLSNWSLLLFFLDLSHYQTKTITHLSVCQTRVGTVTSSIT